MKATHSNKNNNSDAKIVKIGIWHDTFYQFGGYKLLSLHLRYNMHRHSLSYKWVASITIIKLFSLVYTLVYTEHGARKHRPLSYM